MSIPVPAFPPLPTFQGVFLDFLLDQASAFLAKGLCCKVLPNFWSGFSLGLGKTNTYHRTAENEFPQERNQRRPKQLEKRKIKIMKNRTNIEIFATTRSVIVCFGLLPQMQAISPSPDRCYPGFTTAE